MLLQLSLFILLPHSYLFRTCISGASASRVLNRYKIADVLHVHLMGGETASAILLFALVASTALSRILVLLAM